MALMGWSLTNSTLIFVLNSLIRTAVRNYFFTEGGNGSVWQLTTSEKDLLGLKQQHIGRSMHEQPKLVGCKIRTWHPVCPKPVLEFFDVEFAVAPLAVKPLIYFLWGFHNNILVTTCLTLVPSLLHSTFVITGWTSVSTSSDWWNPVGHNVSQTRHSRLRTQVNMVEIHVQRYEQMKMLQWYECGAAYNLSAKKTFFGKISVILSFASYNHL